MIRGIGHIAIEYRFTKAAGEIPLFLYDFNDRWAK